MAQLSPTDPNQPTEPAAPATPPAAGSPPSPSPPAPAAPPAASPSTAPAGTTSGESDDDDDDLEGDQVIQLSKKKFAARLARASKAQLRELFGTDDVEAIKASQEELKTLRAREEENRKAKLSEDERRREELASERKLREQAEARVERVEIRAAERAGAFLVKSALEAVVDPEYHDVVADKLARDIKRNPDAYQAGSGRKAVNSFIKDYIAKHPARAKGYTPPQVPKTPLQTGPKDPGPEAEPRVDAAGGNGVVDMRKLSKEEFRAAMRQKGYTV
jgi:hypothetical protein